MPDPGWIAGLAVAAGLFFFGLAGVRLRRRRLLAATRSGLAGCTTLALAGLLIAVGFNLYTYQRLTYEQPVATLAFEQLGPQHYRVNITPAGSQTTRVYQLRGDQWQLDARVLKWNAPANLLGLNSLYRLQRISGRYTSIAQENTHQHTARRLATDAGVDIWQLARHWQHWLPLVDAYYGSAAYLPMANGARYSVSLTQSGLIARPNNQAARDAISRWR